MLVLKPSSHEDIVLLQDGKEIVRLRQNKRDKREMGIETDKSIVIRRVPAKEGT